VGISTRSEAPVADPVALSVVIGTRQSWREVGRFVESWLPELAEVGGEAVIASGQGGTPKVPQGVHWLASSSDNVLLLRLQAIRASRGRVVAIGEDHAAPRPGWCTAIVRAHEEHPEAAAIVGCLQNATSSTVAGRANFLAFAAPFQHPMPCLYPFRPPPISALSFKHAVLAELPLHDRNPGVLEAELVPRLFADNAMEVDDRIVVDHYQDHGMLWSVINAVSNTRANYGYATQTYSLRRRMDVARWIVSNLPHQLWTEATARAGRIAVEPLDLAAVAALIAATVGGAIVGTFGGPGKAGDRVA